MFILLEQILMFVLLAGIVITVEKLTFKDKKRHCITCVCICVNS